MEKMLKDVVSMVKDVKDKVEKAVHTDPEKDICPHCSSAITIDECQFQPVIKPIFNIIEDDTNQHAEHCMKQWSIIHYG